MGSMSIWHWLIVLVVVVVVFGTGKLRNAGSDLGKAVKGFKDGVKTDEKEAADQPVPPPSKVTDKGTIEVDAKEKNKL